MHSCVLGIDLGGTKLSAKLMSQDGSELEFKSFPTDSDFLLQLHTLYAEYRNRWGKISVVSLGVPGPVSEGIMGVSFPLNTKAPTNFCDCFPGVDELIVKNDLYMATYAELKFGIGTRQRNFVLVSVSTGIGVGVVINGEILNARTEMGHQVLFFADQDIKQCSNHSGCWASVCSGKAIESSEVTLDFDQIKQVNRLALANLVAAYDPQAIVLMGGVATNLFDKVIPSKEGLSGLVIHSPLPEILLTQLGSEIGVIGALKLAHDRFHYCD